MKTLEQLIQLVNKANKKQLWSIIWDFEMIGFYREDKRKQRSFIIDCLTNCYTTEKTIYGTFDSDSLRMEKSIINSMLM